MNITEILNSVKGKVLDVAHFDLLKHAYELQEENIKQLKTNNEALKESKDLLLKNIQNLEDENKELRASNAQLKKEIPEVKPDSSFPELSEVADSILQLYLREDKTEMYNGQIVKGLSSSFNRIQVESGIDDLIKAKLIYFAGGSLDDSIGNCYFLDSLGKKHLANNSRKSA